VPKQPAKALPADPTRRRGVRYVGEYVVSWDDGSWEWLKCVNCGRPLTTTESRERGCGTGCEAVVTNAAKEAILSSERRNAELNLEQKRNPKRPRRPSVKRAPVDTSGPGTIRLAAASRSQTPRPGRKQRGITNQQAKQLAALQRAAGEAYGGSGITEREARSAILSLKRRAET
jgi:hypothetical protein